MQKETRQSAIDPFNLDYDKYPEFAKATPYVFVFEPGEIVLVPMKWWHYAVAIDHSLTAMRNFYHTETNMKQMVTYFFCTRQFPAFTLTVLHFGCTGRSDADGSGKHKRTKVLEQLGRPYMKS